MPEVAYDDLNKQQISNRMQGKAATVEFGAPMREADRRREQTKLAAHANITQTIQTTPSRHARAGSGGARDAAQEARDVCARGGQCELVVGL